MIGESRRLSSELLWRCLLRAPLLSEASAASALVFGVFEFAFYWSGIVALAAGVRWLA
jgi:hypothetical protein